MLIQLEIFHWATKAVLISISLRALREGETVLMAKGCLTKKINVYYVQKVSLIFIHCIASTSTPTKESIISIQPSTLKMRVLEQKKKYKMHLEFPNERNVTVINGVIHLHSHQQRERTLLRVVKAGIN